MRLSSQDVTPVGSLKVVLFPTATAWKQTWELGGEVPAAPCCFTEPRGPLPVLLPCRVGLGGGGRVLSCLPGTRIGGLPALGSLGSIGKKQERARQAPLALKAHTYQ